MVLDHGGHHGINATFSTDGRWIAMAGARSLRLFSTGGPVHSVDLASDLGQEISEVDFSKDGQIVLGKDLRRKLTGWDATSGRRMDLDPGLAQSLEQALMAKNKRDVKQTAFWSTERSAITEDSTSAPKIAKSAAAGVERRYAD